MTTEVLIYGDGSCLGNPGAGGFGTVLILPTERIELIGGYKRTTNNRMELMALIKGLECLDSKFAGQDLSVVLCSDSKYIIDALNEGWAVKWRANNWKLSKGGMAKNSDLWGELLDLVGNYDAGALWIKGHAGERVQERCDELARAAADRAVKEGAEDVGYMKEQGSELPPAKQGALWVT